MAKSMGLKGAGARGTFIGNEDSDKHIKTNSLALKRRHKFGRK